MPSEHAVLMRRESCRAARVLVRDQLRRDGGCIGSPKPAQHPLLRYALSQITVIFEDGTDIYYARQLVAERLAQARSNLPKDLDPRVAPIATGLGEIFSGVPLALLGGVAALALRNMPLSITAGVGYEQGRWAACS